MGTSMSTDKVPTWEEVRTASDELDQMRAAAIAKIDWLLQHTTGEQAMALRAKRRMLLDLTGGICE